MQQLLHILFYHHEILSNVKLEALRVRGIIYVMKFVSHVLT